MQCEIRQLSARQVGDCKGLCCYQQFTRCQQIVIAGTHRVVAKESTSSRKMMQPGSVSAALNTSASRRSLSPYHLEAKASRGMYTSATEAWLAITLHSPLLLCHNLLCYRKAFSANSQVPKCTCRAVLVLAHIKFAAAHAMSPASSSRRAKACTVCKAQPSCLPCAYNQRTSKTEQTFSVHQT